MNRYLVVAVALVASWSPLEAQEPVSTSSLNNPG